MEKSKKMRYFQILLLVLGAGSIYVLPYIRTNFQQPFIDVFGLDMSSMSDLYAMLGLMFIIGYVPSGWIADKFSAKKLIVISLLVTGLTGLYTATIPDSSQLTIIFLIWGISTVFTFWSALIKAISLLSRPDEKAKVFGLLDGGRGVIEAILATLGLTVFSLLVRSTSGIEATTTGLQGVIVLYSVNVLVIGILIAIFLKEDYYVTDIAEEEKVKATMADFIVVFKTKEVWLMSAVIFTGYTLFWTTYYLGGYVQVAFGVSVTAAATMTTAMMWMRPIGGIGGGILADKIGKEKVLATVMGLGSVALIVFSLVGAIPVTVITFFVLFIGLMSYAVRGLYWSLLDDCDLNPNILGVAIGFISFIGYLPDIIIPKLSSPLFAYYGDGVSAYSIYFIVSAIVCIVGILFVILFGRLIKNQKEVNNA